MIKIIGVPVASVLKNIKLNGGISQKELNAFSKEELEVLLRLRDKGWLIFYNGFLCLTWEGAYKL